MIDLSTKTRVDNLDSQPLCWYEWSTDNDTRTAVTDVTGALIVGGAAFVEQDAKEQEAIFLYEVERWLRGDPVKSQLPLRYEQHHGRRGPISVTIVAGSGSERDPYRLAADGVTGTAADFTHF